MPFAKWAVVGVLFLMMTSCYYQKEPPFPQKDNPVGENKKIGQDRYGVFNSYYPNGKIITNDKNLPIFGWTFSTTPVESRVLIEFALPQKGAPIKKASLYLYAETSYVLSTDWGGGHTQPDGNSNAWKIQRITAPWDTNTTWLKQPTTDTQNEILLGRTTSFDQNYVLDVTKLVQDGLDNPNNYNGWMMKMQNPMPYRCVVFHSANSLTAAKRPRLEIEY